MERLRSRRGKPFKGGIRPGHILLICLLLIFHQAYGKRGYKLKSEDEEEGEIEHFEVFKEDFAHVAGPFMIAFWVFAAGLSRVVFHMIPKMHEVLPESCFLIMYGIVIGFMIFLTSNKPPLTFTPELFFLLLLPLIIFDAGYFMPNRMFFEHLGTILLMAVIGTVWNMLTIGGSLYACGLGGYFGDDPPDLLETFLFSSLISAVDPVAVLALFDEIKAEEIIYIIVFGESLLNDGVTVVLYDVVEAFVKTGQENITTQDIGFGVLSFFVVAGFGTCIGIVWGYIAGFISRFTRNATILEPIMIFAMGFLSYYTAEMFKLSAILSITAFGITCKNYVERNISPNSQANLKFTSKMMASASETIIFIFLGIVTVSAKHDWNWGFVGFTILFASVYRTLGVLLFGAIANRFRLYKLGPIEQFIMSYGGMRGGVAFALVLMVNAEHVPHAPMFVTTTLAVVFWTSFVQGITIKPLVKIFGVKTMEEKNPTMNERLGVRVFDHAVSAIVGVLGEFDGQRQRELYRDFDNKFIKPWLLREPPCKDAKIVETFQKRIEDDAIQFMKKNPTQFTQFQYSVEHKPSDSVAINIKQRSSKDYTDSEMKDILSENMIEPTRKRRLSSVSLARLSHDESDALHGYPHSQQSVSSSSEKPVTTSNPSQHQVKQAARRLSRSMSKDSFKNLPVVKEANDDSRNEGYDNPAFDRSESIMKEEENVLKNLDNVIDNVKLD